ncbi:MAG: hypothetical protein KGS00_05950 [Alphaproteobacteria bacterium]|nr:hypothetical protein [Alphaproteobacteria bacterium]
MQKRLAPVRSSRLPAGTWLLRLGAVFLFLTPPALADNTPQERTFLERTAIAAADRACNLFNEGERLALVSGLYQAEGALLRANYPPDTIRALAADVSTHAASLGCRHPSVTEVADLIRDSYRQFQKTGFLEYPALHSSWLASRSRHDRWAVSQTDPGSGIVLGLRRPPGAARKNDFALAVAIPARQIPPSVVQLFIRDPARMGEPWLGGLSTPSRSLSAPPRRMAKPEWAALSQAETDSVGAAFQVFYFPASAIGRIEALDPREAIQLELTPSPRDAAGQILRINFEAGDFRAAKSFALIPEPTYPTPASARGR